MAEGLPSDRRSHLALTDWCASPLGVRPDYLSHHHSSAQDLRRIPATDCHRKLT